jgi:outer membrane protein
MLKYIIIVSITITALFADMKIGYVDSNRIMMELEDVRQVQVELEKEQRKLEAQYTSMIQKLDSLQQDYERQRLLMSDSRRKEKETEMINEERSIQQFQMQKFGQDGEIYQIQNRLLAPVLQKINIAIEKIGSEKGYDYILDAVSGAIVYAVEGHDLTNDVIQELQSTSTQGTK